MLYCQIGAFVFVQKHGIGKGRIHVPVNGDDGNLLHNLLKAVDGARCRQQKNTCCALFHTSVQVFIFQFCRVSTVEEEAVVPLTVHTAAQRFHNLGME